MKNHYWESNSECWILKPKLFPKATEELYMVLGMEPQLSLGKGAETKDFLERWFRTHDLELCSRVSYPPCQGGGQEDVRLGRGAEVVTGGPLYNLIHAREHKALPDIKGEG